MRTPLITVFVALLATVFLPQPTGARPMSDEEKKRAFIESRRGSTSPAAKSTPERSSQRSSAAPERKKRATKPKVAPRKSSSRSSRSSTRPRATPTPSTATATPEATPAPTPSARSSRSSRSSRSQRQNARSSRSSRSTAPIVITKTGLQEEEEYLPPVTQKRGGWFRRSPKYKYLTPSVRKAIDKARIRKGRWVNIVVHNSGTRQGSAKAFDYYHRKVRKMSNGLAYHFVIGNGTSTGNGEIEIGSRWTRQINGGHVRSNMLNNISLGICLVGDYNRDKPKPEQLASLDELIRYLRKRIGKTRGKLMRVETHKGINPSPTDCPGNRFPYKWFYQSYEKR